jgi:hypothetical protein
MYRKTILTTCGAGLLAALPPVASVSEATELLLPASAGPPEVGQNSLLTQTKVPRQRRPAEGWTKSKRIDSD